MKLVTYLSIISMVILYLKTLDFYFNNLFCGGKATLNLTSTHTNYANKAG